MANPESEVKFNEFYTEVRNVVQVVSDILQCLTRF